jgi:hypothetical protein
VSFAIFFEAKKAINKTCWRIEMRTLLQILFLFIPLSLFSITHQREKAVTHQLAGRTGDNILNYCRAKWASYKYGLTLFYQPFRYSDQFVFHDVEEIATPVRLRSFQTRIPWSEEDFLKPVKRNTLFIMQHIPDSHDEYKYMQWDSVPKRGPYISVDWEDPMFKEMMRQLVRPKHPLKLFYPPQNIVTVALHYRSGEGFDSDLDHIYQPLRLPTREFFLEQLQTLHALVGYAPMYVYLFTDHPDPISVKQLFEEQFSENVHFECRDKDNHHDSNVLEDMFSMINFDCLIRSTSHYSTVSSHLGDHKILIYPINRTRDGVFKVRIITRALWDQESLEWEPLSRIRRCEQ